MKSCVSFCISIDFLILFSLNNPVIVLEMNCLWTRFLKELKKAGSLRAGSRTNAPVFVRERVYVCESGGPGSRWRKCKWHHYNCKVVALSAVTTVTRPLRWGRWGATLCQLMAYMTRGRIDFFKNSLRE